MQRRAQQGYNTQWCFHAFSNTLPAGAHPPESVKSLRETLIAATTPVCVYNDSLITANINNSNNNHNNNINDKASNDSNNDDAVTTNNIYHTTATIPNNSSLLSDHFIAESAIQMNAMLHDYIASKGVVITSLLDDSHDKEHKDRIRKSLHTKNDEEFAPVLIFLLDIEGTIVPLPNMRQAMSDITYQYIESTVETEYPADDTIREIVNAAANFCPELKNALEQYQQSLSEEKKELVNNASEKGTKCFSECVSSCTAESIANVKKEFIRHVYNSMESSTKFPHIQQLKSYLWVKNANRAKLSMRLFSDAATFIKEIGNKMRKYNCNNRLLHSTYEHRETRIAIYSSGETEAQLALLRNTTEGDLTPYIFTHFDLSNAGSKLNAKSYGKIRRQLADQLNLPSDSIQIIFMTDSPTEVSAAEASGEIECSLLCVRPGNSWITYDTFLAVSVAHICTFDQILYKCKAVNFDALISEIHR